MMLDPSAIEVGALLSAERLLAQTAYLLTVAVREEPSLAGHGWPTPRTHELQEISFRLQEALRLHGGDLTFPAAGDRHAILEQAREWGLQLILYLHNALEPAHPALEAVHPPPEGWQLEAMRRWLDPLVDLAHAQEQPLSYWGGGTLFAQAGATLSRQLRRLDPNPRLPELTFSESRVIELKAMLYVLLRKLVRCGQALWISDPVAAQAYHLRYLDPRYPVPAELVVPGTGVLSGLHRADLYEPAPPIASELEGDFRVETLASAPVVPMGHEEIRRVAPGWYHPPEVYQEGPDKTVPLQGGREHTAAAPAGMATGTEWEGFSAPDADEPESRRMPEPGKGGIYQKGMPGKGGADTDQVAEQRPGAARPLGGAGGR